MDCANPVEDSVQITLSTAVDGGRNELNNFIGQVIGQDKTKLAFSLDLERPDDVRRLFAAFDRRTGGSFVNQIEMWDAVLGQFVTKNMYVSDRTGKPYMFDPRTFEPKLWRDVQLSLVEV